MHKEFNNTFLSHSEFASCIYNELITNKKFLFPQRNTTKPFVIYVLGPPCVGKTFFQKSLFRLIGENNITFIRASGCIVEREQRHSGLIGECSDKAYDIQKLRTLYSWIINGESVRLSIYNHKTGVLSKQKHINIQQDGLIYLEGIAWSYLLDLCVPDYIICLLPMSIENWLRAYCYRNITYRGYSQCLAQEMCGLLKESWSEYIKNLSKINFPQNAIISTAIVDYRGTNFMPYYKPITFDEYNGGTY